MTMVLVLGLRVVCGVGIWGNTRFSLVRSRLRGRVRVGMLLEVTMVVRLTFPPAAVYHASKMHSREGQFTAHSREAA